MDYLRSCYSTVARFDPALPDELLDIHWYFTEPGATLLAGPTPFRSKRWWRLGADDGNLGEVGGAPCVYSKGVTPSPYPPQTPCGNPDDFRNGIELGGVNPIGPNGVKSCCNSPLPCCGGHAVMGDTVTLTLPPAVAACWGADTVGLTWNGLEWAIFRAVMSACPACLLSAFFGCGPGPDAASFSLSVEVESAVPLDTFGGFWVAESDSGGSCTMPVMASFTSVPVVPLSGGILPCLPLGTDRVDFAVSVP